MTIETNAAPGAAAEIDAPALANPEGVANPAAEETTEQKDVPEHERTIKKLERRIGNVTRSRYEAEARAQQAEERARALEERMARLEAAAQPREGQQPKQQPNPDPRADDDRVNQRAEEIATVRETTARSNKVFESGIKDFGDEFKSSVAAVLEEAGPLIDRKGMPTPLGEAVLDSDNPAALLHYLGQNPEDAGELRGLTPARLGRALVRIEAQIAAEKTKPAKPLQPVTPKGNPKPKSDQEMTDAEWYAARKRK